MFPKGKTGDLNLSPKLNAPAAGGNEGALAIQFTC